jgi:hypothetical protein
MQEPACYHITATYTVHVDGILRTPNVPPSRFRLCTSMVVTGREANPSTSQCLRVLIVLYSTRLLASPGPATLLSKMRGLQQELTDLPEFRPLFSNIPFLVLIMACTQQLLRSTCQALLERVSVLVLLVQPRECVESLMPVALGKRLPTSLSFPSTLGARSSTGGPCIAAREVEGCEDSMACEVSLHAGRHLEVSVEAV